MTLTAADQRDAGALIAKALDPKLRTSADPEYHRGPSRCWAGTGVT